MREFLHHQCKHQPTPPPARAREILKMPRTCSGSASKGFTLLELVIAVAIIGILASIAYPSYQKYVLRSKRTAAQAEMMNIANLQQQYFLANRSYADKTSLGYAVSAEVASNYVDSIQLDNGPPPGFTITFTAKGAQAVDGNLSLTSSGEKRRILGTREFSWEEN